MHPRRPWLALTALALLAAACGGGDGGTSPTEDGSAAGIQAQVASFDMATGTDQRLLVGVFGPDRGIVGGGEVQVRVGHLGDGTQTEIAMSDPVTATFLPVPGKEPEVGDTPQIVTGTGAGVYEAHVDLDRPGNWGVQVVVELDGQQQSATSVFQVGDAHRVPAVGDPAPHTDNPTVDTPDVDPITLDSRAQGDDAEVPDPELHDASIATAIDEGRPVVVVVSTPVYCVSQFCGPVTETIATMSQELGDRAAFVHLEVWQDFESQELNPAAKEWVFDPETGGNEPWVFLVGADGTVQARWDNVLDADELRAMLEELPATPA